VGSNESTTTKNVGVLLAILIAMQMRRYDAGHITQCQWSTSRASLEATGCRHQVSECYVLPQQPPWSTNLNETYKTLPKHIFNLANTAHFDH
jgi:hypothetical protein